MSPPSSPRRLHRIRTDDGWPITLHEYGDPADPRPPILLCHGAFSNHFIYDLGRGFGLAPFLARDGRRIFCVDLRGRGGSLPRRRGPRLRALLARGWTIDDLVERDLPAAIGFVVAHTGAPQVDYVGHSMGGLLIMAYLTTLADPRVRRVVSVGSADFGSMDEARAEADVPQLDLSRLLAPLVHTLPLIPVRPFARALSRLLPVLPRASRSVGWNAANVDPGVLRRYLEHGLVNASTRKLRVFRNLPPPDALARYRHPTLWIAGSRDRLVAPEITRRSYERAGSSEKELQLLSRATGARADYGHADLLIGRYAEEEVFPAIARFLA